MTFVLSEALWEEHFCRNVRVHSRTCMLSMLLEAGLATAIKCMVEFYHLWSSPILPVHDSMN